MRKSHKANLFRVHHYTQSSRIKQQRAGVPNSFSANSLQDRAGFLQLVQPPLPLVFDNRPGLSSAELELQLLRARVQARDLTLAQQEQDLAMEQDLVHHQRGSSCGAQDHHVLAPAIHARKADRVPPKHKALNAASTAASDARPNAKNPKLPMRKKTTTMTAPPKSRTTSTRLLTRRPTRPRNFHMSLVRTCPTPTCAWTGHPHRSHLQA